MDEKLNKKEQIDYLTSQPKDIIKIIYIKLLDSYGYDMNEKCIQVARLRSLGRKHYEVINDIMKEDNLLKTNFQEKSRTRRCPGCNYYYRPRPSDKRCSRCRKIRRLWVSWIISLVIFLLFMPMGFVVWEVFGLDGLMLPLIIVGSIAAGLCSTIPCCICIPDVFV